MSKVTSKSILVYYFYQVKSLLLVIIVLQLAVYLNKR